MKTIHYIPWPKVLKATSAKPFKDSKSYDIGDGDSGKQKGGFRSFH